MVRKKSNMVDWLKVAWRRNRSRLGGYVRRVRSWRWWQRWPVYIVAFIIIFQGLSWAVDKSLPSAKPEYGVSFSIKYAKELGNDWQANYLALLDNLNFKHLRLMSYWDSVQPTPKHYDFADLDWQFKEAAAHHAKVSLMIGYRQPRYPECHEPAWAKKLAVESQAWRTALYKYLTVVVNHYKNNPALESYQLENEAKNNWFGSCRGSSAPTDRLKQEFKLVKQIDPKHSVLMSLSDEHGFPIGQPVPDAYGFSIYRIVYSTNTPIHFYVTYPITDWYHRLRVFYLNHVRHRPVFIHELQLEPWGPKATKDLTIAQQNQSMSVSQIPKNLAYARKTGIKLEYLWGAEWWYWRMTKLHDPGPWNVIKATVEKYQTSSD